VTSASIASNAGNREGADIVVIVVEQLDVQRHGVGDAPDMSRHHRHRAELAQGARVAQQHTIQQSPLNIGQGDAQEGGKTGGARVAARFFLVPALATIKGSVSRATNGKVTKTVASTMPGTAKGHGCCDRPNSVPSKPCMPNTRT